MKIKITSNVVHGTNVLKKDEVHDVQEEHADKLIKGGFAKKHTGKPEKPEEQQQQQP